MICQMFRRILIIESTVWDLLLNLFLYAAQDYVEVSTSGTTVGCNTDYLYLIYSISDFIAFGIMEMPTETKKRHAKP